jgi:hypothetical protein
MNEISTLKYKSRCKNKNGAKIAMQKAKLQK